MAAATTVVEGKIKFREGKKWKPRWCVLKKPSPVADQLQVVLFKDVNEVVKDDPKPKSVFALDSFFGLDSGFPFDRETNVLAIICQKQVHLMAFDLSEKMIEFEIRIRQSLGEENQFPVTVVKAPSNSRLPKEQVRMMIHDLRFCLIAQAPPKILLSWNIEDLRRFGATDGKFCFEGGTRCGKGTGVFALHSEQAEDIADIVKLASTGKMSNCHRKFKNRRRLSSDVENENENMDQLNYTTVTLPIEVTPNQGNIANTERYTTRPLSWSQGLATSQHLSESSGQCSSPAKTVLRPRSGQEYVLIQRILRLPHTGQEMPSPPSKVFNFDPHFETLSHFSSLQSSPQHSPNFSSMADTTRSCNSFHCDAWDRDHSSRNSLQRHPHPLKHITTAVSSPCSSPHTVMPQLQPYLTDEQLSSHSNTIEDSIFFPRDRSDTSSQPPSPYHQPSPSIHLHYPIYVNQEYIPKQHSTSPSIRSSSTSSSHSSTSPIKAGVHSLMTLFFSPKHTSSSDSHASRPTNRVSCNTRHSESDATKLEKNSFSLPPRRSSQVLSLPVNVQRSHSDPKRLEKGEKPVLSLPPKQPITGHVPKEPIVGHSSKVHKQEYDKFANSSIISRRRLQCTEVKVEGQSLDSVVNSCRLPETEPSDSVGHRLQIPQLKSSGYKNIDTFNAAAAVASSSAHATTVSYTPLTGHLSLLPNISELIIPSNEVHSTDENLHSPGTKSSLNSLSYGSNSYPPPPLIPRRHTSSSSPLSSRSSSSSDISDSPPSYYAPSPPAMLPALPPREPLMPPIPLPSPAVTSSPSETDEVLPLSDEEQELNYIEVDMTKTRSAATPSRPPAYVRRSKRVQQKKEKDYAKLRYVLIDHSATKALMEARQEHVQARDG
ncbi:unnamed protein product, partial [Lymnaea stagnalis]